MPYFHIATLEERYPREWDFVKNKILIEMISQGWNKHAKKFTEVLMKKARRLLKERHYC